LRKVKLPAACANNHWDKNSPIDNSLPENTTRSSLIRITCIVRVAIPNEKNEK
jgi:hypothetical protein